MLLIILIEISVIIPCYKPDNTLYGCLASLQKQTLSCQMFEILLVLNGKKNPHYDLIKKYVKELSINNLRLFYEKEANVSNARNIGIQHSQGENITFIDADDWVSENYLASLLPILQTGYIPVSNVICFDISTNSFYKDYLGKCFERLKKTTTYSHIQIRSYFSTPFAKLIPKKFIKNRRFNELFSYGEDALFMFEIEPNLPSFKVSKDSCTYFRRITKNSLSRKQRTKKEVFNIHIKLLFYYSRIYFHKIYKYNFFFFCTRILAICRHLIEFK